jgi:oligopeptide/dipeptide ABC transporter ATP-binding protein
LSSTSPVLEASPAAGAALLSVEGLCVEVETGRGPVRLVEDISFQVAPGEVLGLVGESGCGKSVTAMSVLRLMPEPPSRIAAGAIRFANPDLTYLDLARLDRRRMRDVRGSQIGMVFQEPMTSLNPTFSVGWQLAEALRLHTKLRGAALRARLVEALGLVGIGAPERRLAQYPHELSGGLRQRVMIAMALACGPKLLIADEPTTALDVTVQLQILELIDQLRREVGMAVLLITHDLGVISGYADRVAVMYAGRIVETAPAAELFRRPRHPYTGALLAARPRLTGPREVLAAIPGTVPPPHARPAGCPFVTRCPRSGEHCATEMPPFIAVAGHGVACWHPLA